MARSEACVCVGSGVDDESEAAAAAAAAAAASAANSVTVGQFIGWLLSTAASASGGAYSGDTSTDAGSSPDSMHGRPNTAQDARSEQQKYERRQLRNLLSQIKEGVLDVIEVEAAKYGLRCIVLTLASFNTVFLFATFLHNCVWLLDVTRVRQECQGGIRRRSYFTSNGCV